MWRQRKSAPDAVNRCTAEAAGLGHLARGPVSGGLWRGLQRQRQYPPDILVAEFARGSRTWLIEQTIQPVVDITLTPFAYRLFGSEQHPGNLGIATSFTCQQDDARTHGESLCGLGSPAPGLQLFLIFCRYFEGYEWASHGTSSHSIRCWAQTILFKLV